MRPSVLSRLGARPALALLMLLGSSACEPKDQTPVGRGSRIFQRTCSSCHGVDGRGVRRMGLARPPRDLTKPEFHAQASDERLRTSIRLGKGQMPAFGNILPPEDIENLIAFVRTLNRDYEPPTPGSKPVTAPGSPASGTASAAPPSREGLSTTGSIGVQSQ
jgi:mono/diheme cytochrome c family protein